jgi:hypothetical protein
MNTKKRNSGVVVILNDTNEDKKKKIKLFEEAREQDKEMFLFKQKEVRFKQEEVCLRDGESQLSEKVLRLKEEREENKFIFLDTSLLDVDG